MPAAHVGQLLRIVVYIGGAVLAVTTLASAAVLGVPLWLAGLLVLAEVAGCAYVLVTRA